MPSRAARPHPAPDATSPTPEIAPPGAAPDGETADGAMPALDALGVVGITRRRVAWLLGAIVATWIVIVFARQVGEASTASARAAELQASNADLAANVAALQRELATIQEEPFVLQQARANGLGSPNERPFRLAPGAPPLPADAPGSAISRLGPPVHHQTPLESWLSLLFGPSPGA
jgi:cell division protein FtsB